MLKEIDQWIDNTLDVYSDKKQSCIIFASEFAGYYPAEFLSKSFFVVVDEIPKPNFPELRQAGLGDFIDMPVAGITYKNTYFVQSSYVNDLSLHFHELVHVIQWETLGAQQFIQRYMAEIQIHGYKSAPLEKIAYYLQDCYEQNDYPEDMFKLVNDLMIETSKG